MENNAKPDILAKLKGKIRKFVIPGTIILVIAVSGAGAWLWYLASHIVSTDNARIDAALISVSALNPGRLNNLDVDIGSYVEAGERIAVIELPSVLNSSGQNGFGGFPTRMANITAPTAGFVAAVWSEPGSVVAAGQPIITLYDPTNVWVTANVKETAVSRIHPGQRVEINVDSLGDKKLGGTVLGVASATAATFSLLPQQNTSGNFTKIIQVVPVKIAIERLNGSTLIPGSSVEVKIFTKS